METLPDPSLAKEIGAIAYIAIALVLAAIAALAWFLRRMAAAMDRIATAQEAYVPQLTALNTRMESLEGKVDGIAAVAAESREIARLWKNTEAADRTVRKPT